MPLRDRIRQMLGGAGKPATSASAPRPAPAASPESAAPAARPDHELILYKYDSCPYCRRVMRVVDGLDLEGIIEYRDTRRERKWRSDLVERTGRTQVPCLFIDGQAMFESADISDWLRSNYG